LIREADDEHAPELRSDRSTTKAFPHQAVPQRLLIDAHLIRHPALE
jgi:hypothetical protein